MKRYCVINDKMYEFDGVPDDAVPFGVGAPCPEHERHRIAAVDYEHKRFACETPVTGYDNHDSFPTKTHEIFGTTLVVFDEHQNVHGRITGRISERVPA